MSGISRMVPTLIMGGVILAFSQLIAYSWLKIPADFITSGVSVVDDDSTISSYIPFRHKHILFLVFSNIKL